MHLFTALLFTSDDSSALPSIKKQKAVKSVEKSKKKFHFKTYLKDKLLEPSIKKIYGKCSQCGVYYIGKNYCNFS